MHRLAAPLCLILLACTAPAAAQSPIHRCIGANGGAVFTDQPCMALQATPLGPSTTPSAPASPQAAPPPILCAANAGELRQSVIDAFASRDANRLAGLMLWDGYGRGAAIADIRSLAELMKQPLLGVDVPGDDAPAAPASAAAPPPMDAAPATPSPGQQLVLHTSGNDGSGSPRELRFDLVRQAGCLWLRSAN
ncbi:MULTISPECIES: DUF4124 domain-containing protein [Rhodanobacter]|uniref:DUF4124 domain-containing protein n=1 Tax=Rhodanobacter TaxID=75309 RepID=UPI00041086E6|nr:MULTISPECIES: DUF4124 domain-containing protein [Rhodanobacter]KZC19994.1 hypothetical protein RHOFW104R3_28120 [Rhodanobacter denitrificans]UJJ50467.1 DUF4124 domain-containing protein [Rhodanobacter denitrificans]UJM93182.1 DUF4124 domain-containing protein [Rhodanobacter denitrificans]UJM96714.1 DUF4124 domain-containing protein [Rhodanobacter denitrificans]UJN20457.1 DUF4124 domain-containing protein [Rhodanobacter denitrificans]